MDERMEKLIKDYIDLIFKFQRVRTKIGFEKKYVVGDIIYKKNEKEYAISHLYGIVIETLGINDKDSIIKKLINEYI